MKQNYFKGLFGAVGIVLLMLPTFAHAQMAESDIITMTQTSFANFKANKWNNFGSYWGWMTADGTGYRYFWEQALCMMALEDEAEYGTSPDAKAMVVQNLDGFITYYGSGYGLGWNDYIDDIGWVQCAFARGFRITGDRKYLNAATQMFNVGFSRGNLGPVARWANTNKDGREGLWWRVSHNRYMGYDATGKGGTEGTGAEVKNQDFYKSPLSTSPHIVTGAYLYKFTGKQEYLDKAIKLWEWEINTLWEPSDDSGIHEGQNIPREDMVATYGTGFEAVTSGLRSRRTMHDLSTFFEGTNALYKCTGDRRFLAYCWKIVNSVLYHRLDATSTIQNAFSAKDGSWCWEAGRAWTMFCADNNLWDFKGNIPIIEGKYTDYTGVEKPYTSKVIGTIKTIPNNWTLYQFMANSAKVIKDDIAHNIILPTNRASNNIWGNTLVISDAVKLEAENATQVNGPKIGLGTGKYTASGQQIMVTPISVVDVTSASNGKKVSNTGWGNNLEFTYTAKSAGTCYLEVTYATAELRYLIIKVNSEPSKIMTCDNTGGVNTFSRQEIEVPFIAGDNKIVIGGTNLNWGPDLDYISLTMKTVASTVTPKDNTVNPLVALKSTKIEAETGLFQQPAGDPAGRPDPIATTSNTIFSGGKKISNVGGLNTATYTFNASEAGTYQLLVSYGTIVSSYIELTVNGSLQTIPCTATSSINTMKESRPIQVMLSAGSNTIMMGNNEMMGPDIDYILVNKVNAPTGIESVYSEPTILDNNYYNIYGQRVTDIKQNVIYIHNRKKFILR